MTDIELILILACIIASVVLEIGEKEGDGWAFIALVLTFLFYFR